MLVKKIWTILLFITWAGAVQAAVNPWPQDNAGMPAPLPSSTNTATTPQRILVQPVPNQVPQPSAQNPQQNPALQVLQQMMGRSEFAGGGGGYNTQSGTGSSLELGGSGGVGPAGVSLVNVNACSNQPGKFQFKFGEGEQHASGCDGQIKMHEDMATFMSNQFGRCVSQAAGGINSFNSGKVYHAGTMGNEAHQRTGSLHNYGLAIDINTIVVDGREYSYKKKDANTQAFFTKLRQCWGEAANRERAGCLPNRSSGMPHGTIGDEDHRHHNHIHLSLPMCRQYAGNAFMAWYVRLLIGTAHADEKVDEAKLMPPPSNFTHQKIKIPNGEVTVTIEETGGEPIGADHQISLVVKCAAGKSSKEKFGKIEACDFVEAKFNKKAGVVEAIYKTSRMRNGKVACDRVDVAQAKIRCD